MLYVGGIVIALAILAGGVYWYQNQNSAYVVPTASPVREVMTSTPPLKTGNVLDVEDQPAGATVAIDLAVLTEKGFVVIHESTKDAKPGKVIGHTDLLDAGQNEELQIDLDMKVKAGTKLFAMLHGDSNNDGEYTTLDEDKPLKDAKGDVVMIQFTMTSSSPSPDTNTDE